MISERTPVRTILRTEGARRILAGACPIVESEEFDAELEKFPLGIFLEMHVGRDSRLARGVLEELAHFEDSSPRLLPGTPIVPSSTYEDESVELASARVLTHRLDGGPGPLRAREGVEILVLGPARGNPFVDVDMTASFTCVDAGEQVENGARVPGITVGAVFDGLEESGAGRYLIRFLPPCAGHWAWSTESNARSLQGLVGILEIEDGDARGIVRAKGLTFAYDDGTPFTAFGTTAYAWIAQPGERQERTIATLTASPFNKLRMCVFPKSYSYNREEPERLPFEKKDEDWDPERFDTAFWRNLDERILQLNRIGVQADIILFHSYDRWGFSSMDAALEARYLRYAVRRLAAHPNVWWSMANEYELLSHKSREDWETESRLVASEDHAGHLLSIHNIFAPYKPTSPWITHVSLQSGSGAPQDVARDLERRWGKPVAIDESGYEGDLEFPWGNLTPEEVVRRFWLGTLAGAHMTHGETYLRGDDELWWSKGGELHGASPSRIALLRKMVDESPTGALRPLRRGLGIHAAGVEGEYILEYFAESQPRQRTLNLPDGGWAVELVDTWNLTVEPVGAHGSPSASETNAVHRGRIIVNLPVRPWMAIRARRVKE